MELNLEQILTASSDSKTLERGNRLLGVAKRTGTKILDEYQEKIDNITEKMSELLDMSAETNVNSGINAITNDQMAARMQDLSKLATEKALLEAEFKIQLEFFGQLLPKNTKTEEVSETKNN